MLLITGNHPIHNHRTSARIFWAQFLDAGMCITRRHKKTNQQPWDSIHKHDTKSARTSVLPCIKTKHQQGNIQGEFLRKWPTYLGDSLVSGILELVLVGGIHLYTKCSCELAGNRGLAPHVREADRLTYDKEIGAHAWAERVRQWISFSNIIDVRLTCK